MVDWSEKGREVVEKLEPEPGDYHNLKPQRSAFYATPLEVLLLTLNVSHFVIVGITIDICVLFTAHDAYMRVYELQIPSGCTAALPTAHHRNALTFMKRAVYANTAMSKVNFKTY